MKRISLTAWILIGLVAGIAFGAEFPAAAKQLGLLGTVFLRLIKSIIAPLLFGTLVSGIAGTGSAKTTARRDMRRMMSFRSARATVPEEPGQSPRRCHAVIARNR